MVKLLVKNGVKTSVAGSCTIIFFSIRVFFHRHWRFAGQQGKGGGHLLFHSTTSTRSRTLRHLFATLHVRWLSRILIPTLVFTRLLLDENYHLIELPFDWLIHDAVFVCLLDEYLSIIVLSFLDLNLISILVKKEDRELMLWR